MYGTVSLPPPVMGICGEPPPLRGSLTTTSAAAAGKARYELNAAGEREALRGTARGVGYVVLIF